MYKVNELKRSERCGKIEYLNIAKGIGIFMVVLGHCITKDMAKESNLLYITRLFIYTIHMPLFFIIAGILFQKNLPKYLMSTKKEYIMKKIKVFMIPYFAFSVLNYLIVYFGNLISPLSEILKNQGYILNDLTSTIISILTFINHIDEHLWFCYVMFLTLILNRMFLMNMNKKKAFFLVVIYYFSYVLSAYLPDIIWKTIRYLFIFSIGRIMFLKKHWNKKILFTSGFLLIGSFLLYLFTRLKEFNDFDFLLELLCEISANIIIIFYISKNIKENILKKALIYLGKDRNSYVIYLLHMPFLTSALIFIMQKLNISNYIIILLVTIISIIVVLLVYDFILAKIKIVRKIFFGSEK